MDSFILKINSFKKDIEFAIKNKYSITINYTDEINYENNIVSWKYPPYIIKNFIADKIISEISNYFKNFDNYLIVMHFEGKNSFFIKSSRISLKCYV